MARSFSGSSQHLENGASVLTAEPVTLACWFTLSSSGFTAKTLVSLSQSGGAARCLLQVSSNDKLVVFSGSSGGATAFSEHATVLSLNTWYFGAGVFASASSRLCYLGTVPSAVDTNTAGMSGTNRTNLGARYNSTIGVYHTGLIAEAGIWNAALSAEEIGALAQGLAPPLVRPAALKAYWPLIGRTSPESCVKGDFNLALNNAPTTAVHCRIRRRASRRGMG